MEQEKEIWTKRIDEFRRKAGLKTDAEVAAGLGISKSTLSEVLHGNRDLSAGAKFALLDQLGFIAARDLMLSILPGTAQATVNKAMQTPFYRSIIEKS